MKTWFVLLILWNVIILCSSFNFQAAYVLPTSSTTNVITTYQIILWRNLGQSLENTDWNIIGVPGNFNITIIFPSEYVLSGNETCDSLTITTNTVSSQSITPFSYAVDPSKSSITISNIYIPDLYIKNVSVQLSNVLNPFPAITTSGFIGSIGNDISYDTTVTLQPDNFNSCSITFQPNYTNTTGTMIVTLINKNKLPNSSYFTIDFGSLTWDQEVNINHRIFMYFNNSCTFTLNGSRTAAPCSISDYSSTLLVIEGINNSTTIPIPGSSNLIL
jgi:hypothetical protein